MTRHLAITMGDPAGIGPEIIVKAAHKLRNRLASGDLKLVVIGSNPALRRAQDALGLGIEIPEVSGDGAWPALCCLQADEEGAPIEPGRLSADGGRFAYRAIERAVRLALDGTIGGIVTAPLNKEALNLAGYHYAGHTEMLADLTGVRGSVMMLAHGTMRVSHVTTHVALQDVPKRLTPERLRLVIDLTHAALKGIGLDKPRIAIAALNPHAGEGGLFGREDIDVSTPVIAQKVADGLDIVGPVPVGDQRAKTPAQIITTNRSPGRLKRWRKEIREQAMKLREATACLQRRSIENRFAALPALDPGSPSADATIVRERGRISKSSIPKNINGGRAHA